MVNVAFSQENLNFKQINTIDGLSSSAVRKIVQDPYGFIWFATADGLNRWDGQNTLVIKHDSSNKKSISSDNIFSLLIDSQNRFWIGTDKGLNLFDPTRFTAQHFRYDSLNDHSISGDIISDIYEDNYGRIWFTTRDQRCVMSYINPLDNSFTRFCHDLHDSSSIRDFSNGIILQDANDNYWVGSWLDITSIDTFRIATKKFHHLPFYSRDPSEKTPTPELVHCIYKDSKNNLWFGTYLGVYVYLYDQKRFVHYYDIFDGAANIKTIVEDSDGRMWFGSFGTGLFKFNLETEELTSLGTAFNGLDDEIKIINHLYKDQKGSLWIASENGVYMLDPFQNQFKLITHKNPNLSIGSGSIIEDQEGKLWFDASKGFRDYGGSPAGFMSYYPKTQEFEHHMPNKYIYQLFLLRKEIYFATKTSLYHINKPEQPIIEEASLYLKALFFDDNDTDLLWIVSIRGIYKLNSKNGEIKQFIPIPKSNTSIQVKTFSNKTYDFENASHLTNINRVTKDSRNRLWLILKEYKQDTKQLFTLNYTDSLIKPFFSETIFDPSLVFEDRKNNIWICSENGLYRYRWETAELDNFNESDGLVSSNIFAIMEDAHSFFWLFHSKGITKFNPEKISFENYSILGEQKIDPLSSSNRNYYYNKQRKQMYYGTQEGIIVFNPETIKSDTLSPPLYITALKIHNQHHQLDTAVFAKKHIVLNYEENYFSFDFSVLKHSNPSHNRYEYSLKNYDEKWTNTSKNEASYTKVPPGDYTFLLKAYNDRGLWKTQTTQINISILPPWWLSWWARLLWILLPTLIVVLLVVSRIQSLKSRQQKLQLEVGKRTMEVEQQKREILHQAQRLKVSNNKLQEMSEFKDSMTSMIVHDLKSPLNFIINAPEEDAKISLYRIKESGKQMLNMVLNILDVFKYEDSKLRITQYNYHLKPLIDIVIEEIQYLAQNKKIRISNLVDNNIGIFADKGLFMRIMNNLLVNAIKHTPDNGEIMIISELIKVGTVSINVRDTGQGIDEKDLTKIFDKFVKLNPLDDKHTISTGLGLTFCKMAVEAHGGELSVESKVSKGTTFTFDLPITNNFEHINHQNQSNHSNNSTRINFSPAEKQILSNAKILLSNTMIYEVSKIRKIVEPIPEETENIKIWKKEILACLSLLDLKRFNDLKNMIL